VAAEGRHVYLEHVTPMPSQAGERNMGSTSAFNFGGMFHGPRIVLEFAGLPYTLLPAAVWKKRAGMAGAEKDYARALAARLFPEASESLKRKKDQGRAEAILIARYGAP
jgi:crossover junction endodeoxyribonuclease RuvC